MRGQRARVTQKLHRDGTLSSLRNSVEKSTPSRDGTGTGLVGRKEGGRGGEARQGSAGWRLDCGPSLGVSHRSASLTLTLTLLRGPGPQCPPHPRPSAAESLSRGAAFGLSPPTVLSAPAATAESVARRALEGTKASGTGLRGGFREGETPAALAPPPRAARGTGAWLRACAAFRGRARGAGGVGRARIG